MKALLLAAGIGSRLKPFTDNMPKALFKVEGRSLLEWNLRKLSFSGITDVMVNVHHFHEKIMDFIAGTKIPGLKVHISDESDKLLDTGGALRKTSGFFSGEQAFLIYNSDILCGIDIPALYRTHLDSGNLATLAVKDRESSRQLLFDNKQRLCGWMNTADGNRIIRRPCGQPLSFAFSGIQVVSPVIFEHFPDAEIFSLTTLYLGVCDKSNISAYIHHDPWLDMGRPGKEAEAAVLIKNHYNFHPER